MSKQHPLPAFGILYPGELGAAFGALLVRHGFRVSAVLDGRSRRTRDLSACAGLEEVDGLEELTRRSDYLLSFVPAEAAEEVARDAVRARSPEHSWTYVDCNSISPRVSTAIAGRMIDGGIDYIDGAVHGQSGNLGKTSVLYLSGPGAEDLGRVLPQELRVQCLGTGVSTASGMKMLLGAASKNLVTLFLRVGILAWKMDMLPMFLEQARHFYPGMMEAVQRMAPTYPRHAARRCQEMKHVSETLSSAGMRSDFADDCTRFLEELASQAGPGAPDADDASDLEALIRALGQAAVSSVDALTAEAPETD